MDIPEMSDDEIRRTDLRRNHQVLIDYLLMKAEEHDWHGVSDAANDLRVLEAEHPELK